MHHPSNSRGQRTTRRLSTEARSVSSWRNKSLTTEVIGSHPGSHNVCDATVIATPMEVDEWVHVKN